MPTTQPLVFDAVVIGAGMAGLTAARRLAEARKSTLLLEASERVGGRVWTVQGAAAAIELGAEFVHGEPTPTLSLAREAGVELLPLGDVHFVKHGAAFQALVDPWRPFESVLARLEPDDEDTSAETFVTHNGIDPELAERFRQLVEGFEAAPFEEVSIRSLATDSEGLDEDDSQFRVAGGYGRLVDFQRERALSAGAELRLGVAVQRLKWHLNGPVSVGFGDSTPELTAKICVVAVPLSALQSESSPNELRVEPTISSWRKPLERLAMGHACRYSFELPLDFARSAAPRQAFIHQPPSLFETAWSHETGTSVIWTVWSGGPKAIALAKETAVQREKLALGALANLLTVPESNLLDALLGPARAHDFSNDPRLLGAYSFCRPGGARDSESLAAPVGDALFMAGEATDREYPGTVAGAIASGERAARQAIAALERRPRA
ncbi:MAG: NAD(P)/FAD-dependent oxidoreductase [Myxococcales bacterium]|jgi:monoamine oxidase